MFKNIRRFNATILHFFKVTYVNFNNLSVRIFFNKVVCCFGIIEYIKLLSKSKQLHWYHPQGCLAVNLCANIFIPRERIKQ
jgi:hypothetical protein